MKIRKIQHPDKPEIDRIYNEFFSNNEYPNFFSNKFNCPFVVTNDDDKIILAGGVKTIAETVIVTDRSLPAKTRLNALLQALGSSIFITRDMKYKQIHAFVNNDTTYVKVLQRYGFKLLNDKLLILDFGDSHG